MVSDEIRRQWVNLGVMVLENQSTEKKALVEHKRLAHGGKFSPRCNECRTRQERIRHDELILSSPPPR